MRKPTALSSGSLKANAIASLIAEGSSLLLNSLAFFLLADILGPTEFGYYGSALAYATFVSMVGWFGSQQLLMTDMAAGVAFGQLWGRVTSVVLVGSVAVSALSLLVHAVILPEVPLLEFAVLVVSQVALFGLTEFGVVAAQAHRRLTSAVTIRIWSGLVRIVAVLAFWRFSEPTTAAWSWYGLVGWCASAAVSMVIVGRHFGSWPRWSRPAAADLRRGLPFTFGMGANTVLDAADRPMLVRLAGGEEAGVYHAGYRLIAFATMPIGALVRASDANFFEAGRRDPAEARRLAMRMTGVSLGYGAVAAIGLVAISPLVPIVLGDEYADAAWVLRVLSVMPLVQALQIFPANALTGAGRQRDRNRSLAVAVVLNIALNLAMIPAFGWLGAALATIAAELTMAALLWRYLGLAVARSAAASDDATMELVADS